MMQDELIRKIAGLMAEQSAAYASLQSLTTQLIGALTRSEPFAIESLSKTGESEMLRMRARLLEITSALTDFGKMRSLNPEGPRLEASVREAFEREAQNLLAAARKYEKTAQRGATLALGGSSFAAAAIQMCGVPPSTYRAPVIKYSKAA